MDQREEELNKIRADIDSIDRRIVELILQRAHLVKSVGEVKKRDRSDLYRPDREKEVYENVIRIAHDIMGDELPVPEDVIKNIYREIMSGSIAIEGGIGVAFLGPLSSFSNLAVRQKFGSFVREYPVDTIPEVFRRVESGGEISYGMVPVENSGEGVVSLTLDSFLYSDIKICAEHYLHVSQNLLAAEPIELKDVRKLYTIKIVREQVRNWMQAHLNLSQVEIVETSSTAAAAILVKERRDGVAIASEMAAEMYGLNVIARDIQDQSNNVTRFFVLGKNISKPTGDDKTSIMLTVADRPGSLYSLLEPFYSEQINMTRIESRASRRGMGDYNFYIDFLGHYMDPKIDPILKKLEERTTQLKILGSYPRATL